MKRPTDPGTPVTKDKKEPGETESHHIHAGLKRVQCMPAGTAEASKKRRPSRETVPALPAAEECRCGLPHAAPAVVVAAPSIWQPVWRE